jgi:predicted metal-dependent hydrolase
MVTVDEFKSEVLEFADDIGVTLKEIHFRKMSRKWGSCSTKGRVTFDHSLLNESEKKRCEAIIHELLHIRYPDHGKMFNLMLKVYMKRMTDRL